MPDEEKRLLGSRAAKLFYPVPDGYGKQGSEYEYSKPLKLTNEQLEFEENCQIQKQGIDINDWNVAHKLFEAAWMERGWAVLQEAMRTIFAKEFAEDATRQIYSYFLFHAKAKHYIEVACIAKEQQESSK